MDQVSRAAVVQWLRNCGFGDAPDGFAGPNGVIASFERNFPASSMVAPAPAEAPNLDTTGMDTPWPLRDVLKVLANAADHLLGAHGCDDHGHEETREAVTAARRFLVPAAPPVGGLPAGEKTWTNHALDWIDANVPHGHYLVSEALAATKDLPSLVVPASVGDLPQGAGEAAGERARAHALLTALGFSCVDTTCGWNGQPHQRNCDAAHEALSAVENEGKAAMLELAKVSAAAIRDAGAATPVAAQGALATPGEAEGVRWIVGYCASRRTTELERAARGKGASVAQQIAQASADAFRDVGEHAARLAATPAAQRRPAKEVALELARAVLPFFDAAGVDEEEKKADLAALEAIVEADRRGKP